MRGSTFALAVAGLLGCPGPEPATTPFGHGPESGVPVGTTAESSSSSSTSSTTTIPVPEDSTTSSTSEVGTTEPLLDLGSADLGSLHPQGCAGKIDFLFVISRYGLMEVFQERLIDAFPKFIETIKSKFADFDYHIMIVDGDATWGSKTCNEDCTPTGCPIPDYPCDALATLSQCEMTMGAGSIFPAGVNTKNEPCEIVGDRRYLTSEQPNLVETFTCLAEIGGSGGANLGDALTAAISPDLNGPGGCNEGFLRDDALLMVTFIYNTADDDSAGKPKLWADALLQAKHGDPNAVVLFGLSQPGCPSPWDRICDLVSYYFPYWYVGSIEDEDLGPAFEIATDRVDQACSAFIPQ